MSLDLTKYRASTIGLHGLEDEFKLCHIPFLVVNDVYGAIALEGSSGSGKTTLIDRLGKLNALTEGGGPVGIFSADKARYEDFIGCPIPNLETGQMKIYPMPKSVTTMQTLLIDEINRASYENQEKWLSLLASRRVDGHDTQCKYLFAAMNPVAGEGGDQYEGTQPLDKALGERIMLLIQMPKFSDLPAKDKINIMTACKNQVHWSPTPELVSLHTEFLKRARDFYEEYKATITDKVANYICMVDSKIAAESRGEGGLKLEGRRAQFILTNIIANHALNKVYYDTASLENSALEALIKSFPNVLWQASVNTVALKQAHDLSRDILNMDSEERIKAPNNYDGLEGPLKVIKKAAEDGESTEQLSKIINQEWPSKKLDPINYYLFAIAASIGLAKSEDSDTSKPVIKKNEYARLEKIYKSLLTTEAYLEMDKVVEYANKNSGSFPTDYTRPDFIERDIDPEAMGLFDQTLGNLGVGGYACLAVSISAEELVHIKGLQDYFHILKKMSTSIRAFQKIKITVNSRG